MFDRAVARLLDAVVAGQPVDWEQLQARNPQRLPLLRQLRIVGGIAGARSTSLRDDAGHAARATQVDLAWTGLTVLALLQVAAAIGGYLMGAVVPAGVPPLAYVVVLAGFGATAAWLLVGGHRDRRAHALATVLLLIAASFAPRFLTPLSIFAGLYLQSLLPAALWRFVREFPRTIHYSAADRLARAAERLAAIIGAALLIGNVLNAHGVRVLPSLLVRSDSRGMVWYWTVLFVLLAPAPLTALIRARHAPPDERRRLAIFSLGFGVVLTVAALEILLELAVPQFRRYMTTHRVAATPYAFAFLLLVPIITAYAVAVDSALDVRVTVGRVTRYLFARHVALALTVIPFVALGGYFYLHRQQTVAALVGEWPGWTAGLLFLVGVLLTAIREPILTLLDTHFDRQAIDLPARTSLLTAALGNARSATELCDILEREIAQGLMLEDAVVYARPADAQTYDAVTRHVKPLGADSAIAALVEASSEPILLTEEIRRLLPIADVAWCRERNVDVLVPMIAPGDRLIGVLITAAKLSGDVTTRAERAFLGAAAAAAALRWDALAPRADQAPSHGDEPAFECMVCGHVTESPRGACACRAATRPAAVPVLLAQKFKAVSYIGAGGMGVVYRATDISLNRTVALKTLERLSGAAAERLATEARMMAVVAHPNLATIFGVERWRQTPVLVLEFFERGTLAARLGAAQPIDEMLRLGVLLAPALEQLHASGILHRDIKPSNIGLTRDEAPKLLDFGLASLVTAASREGTRSTRGRSGRETQTVDLGVTHRLAGTPLYLPPETLQGVAPNPAFDLWALSMVLFEAIAGSHPFAADSVEAVLAKVGRARVPDLSTIRRDCPAVVAAAFSGLLAADPGRRPATARDFGSVIAGLL